ncbi:MAG: hypothetical protein JOY57_15105 [Actinobacteria bacterium]|nr:hypothetical protein [Actinomycetota bacterium]
MTTLFVHEMHRVRGKSEEAFEAAWRDEWMPLLGKEDDARLLYYCNHVHGTGPAYTVMTLTAVRDGAAWARLAERVTRGDLRDFATRLDEMRHGVDAKVLLPVYWSPVQDVDFGSVPTTAAEHELTLFMEDTGWPSASLDEYIGFWGETYFPFIQDRPMEQRLLDIQMSFQPAYGGGNRKEAILWQKVVDHQKLLWLFTHETAPELKRPGTFMHDALGYRDEWESRLLRTASWSPWY